jgi:hypothetical protein
MMRIKSHWLRNQQIRSIIRPLNQQLLIGSEPIELQQLPPSICNFCTTSRMERTTASHGFFEFSGVCRRPCSYGGGSSSLALAAMKTLRVLFLVFIGALVCVSFLASSSDGNPVPFIKINPGIDVPKPFNGFDESHGDGMIGWTFQLLEPVIVTHVGWYDENSDGLSRAFQVGLWQGEGVDGSGMPQFLGSQQSSLIGDPTNGLVIPGGTNGALVGVWRVVGLPEPLTLQPGFYEVGGVDTSATADSIKFVAQNDGLTPPSSPLVIGAFFYPWPPPPPGHMAQTNLHPTTSYYAAAGLELGPMLFGSKAPPSPGSGLNVRRFGSNSDPFVPRSVLLTWPTGTLEQADLVTGPYRVMTNAASPYILPSTSLQKFFGLGP